MDIEKLKAEFEQLKYIKEKLEYLNFDEHLGCYVEENNGMPVGLAAWVNGAFYGFEQATKAQAVPGWISVEDGLPPCDFEFCETGERVSNAVLIHSAATYGFNMGMGHVNEDGVWNAYSGEHDFMNVLMVTHWMPLPDAPQEPAND